MTVKLEWKWMDEDAPNQELDQMEPIDRFYVFEGRQIFDFFNAILLKSTMPICQLESYKTAVYKLPHTNSVICLTEGNELNRTAQITEMLRPWINAAKETFAFAFQPTYSYYSERNFDRMCFVRSICDNRPVDTTKLGFVEPMEDSNMISGVSAGGTLYTHTRLFTGSQSFPFSFSNFHKQFQRFVTCTDFQFPVMQFTSIVRLSMQLFRH